ncbi:MAG: polysaccharide deacetylase family protein [Magnetospirillum sp.]|nr:polysaccharide deacetylase family protein [Magnetospirillum sp.]
MSRAIAPPVLSVIVDTEEDFDWSQPFSRHTVAVDSIAAQPSLHPLFRHYGIVPTYLIDWPVATTPAAVKVLRRLLEAGQCEIGAHLHPWVNPPYEEALSPRNSYAGNLPARLEYRKLAALTEAIAAGFAHHPTVYKAGRYGLGAGTATTLEILGYTIDASVVPHTSFGGDGGPDFRGLPDRPFWFGNGDRLLELPLSVGFVGRLAGQGPLLYPALIDPRWRRARLPGLAARLGLLERVRLTPEGTGLSDLKRLTRALLARGHRFFSFCYHSPSLAVGHTPYVRSPDDLAAFHATCEGYFRFFAEEVGGRFATPTQFRGELVGPMTAAA